MKYKYLSISGEEIESETENYPEEIIESFTDTDGVSISITPLVEVDGVSYWNKNTQYGVMTKEKWIKKICPKLIKIYN